MRIVKGRFAGRDLVSPNDARVRPTAEHVRSAMLDALEPSLPGARVLDLFAGSGALGLEAMSRGSASADFVETRPASLHALRANVALFRLRDRTRIFKRDALPFAGALEVFRTRFEPYVCESPFAGNGGARHEVIDFGEVTNSPQQPDR